MGSISSSALQKAPLMQHSIPISCIYNLNLIHSLPHLVEEEVDKELTVINYYSNYNHTIEDLNHFPVTLASACRYRFYAGDVMRRSNEDESPSITIT